MDFVSMLAPLMGLAFLIERFIETLSNAAEQLDFVKRMKEPDPDKSETAAKATAAEAKAKADAEAAAADPTNADKTNAAKASAAEAAAAKVKADEASAKAALKAANYASRKQVLTLGMSVLTGVVIANSLQIPLLTTTAAEGSTLPAFLSNYTFAGAVAGVLAPYAHQILESLLNFQKLLEQTKKNMAGDVTVGEK